VVTSTQKQEAKAMKGFRERCAEAVEFVFFQWGSSSVKFGACKFDALGCQSIIDRHLPLPQLSPRTA